MSLSLEWKHAGLSKIALAKYELKLQRELGKMKQASLTKYKDERASINLCVDKEHVRMVRELAKQHAKASMIIVVGIGGSNLGTMAVQEAVLGKLHDGKEVLYADTVDSTQMAVIRDRLSAALKKRQHVVLNVVSKSGGTTETIANFEVLLAVLKRQRKDYAKYVVVTSDEGSKLWQHAEQEGFACLPIPTTVGGRYSVFSPVGLFPLALMGVKIEKLLSGARKMRSRCLQRKHNPALIRAAVLAEARKSGKNIADNFYFKTDLESVGKWYRQLMGESIGKEHDRKGKRVFMGMTPTVSIGSTDLHSMAQLYFGGPKDKIHTIIAIEKWKKVKVPVMPSYEKLVPKIQGRPLGEIMDAIILGVQSVLKKQGRPYNTITLADAEAGIGALLQMHMMEMMYLAALLNVNPFDQPNVEAYKVETKKVLR